MTRTHWTRDDAERFAAESNERRKGVNAMRWRVVTDRTERGWSLEEFFDPSTRPPAIPVPREALWDNERWLNGHSEQQAALRAMGLKCGALIEEAGKVRYT